MSTAHARNTDPHTSHLAAEAVGDTTPLQRRIMVLFDMAHDGLNDEQLIMNYKNAYGTAFPSTESSIRSRRSDLVAKGYIVDSGRTRPTLHGNKSIVWLSAGRLW
jgi:hypothetical protein